MYPIWYIGFFIICSERRGDNKMDEQIRSNKKRFEFYQNLKECAETLSYDDLEIIISSLEVAKLEMKYRGQKKYQKELKSKKKRARNSCNTNVLRLPSGLKKLNPGAFKGNEKITKVVLNQELTEIGELAFAGCTKLREIVFPNNKIRLRKGCFRDCTALKTLRLPDAIKNIPQSAFENCTSLTSVSMPSNISNIYHQAFKNCTSLKDVRFREGGFAFFWSRTYSGAFEKCLSLEYFDAPKGMFLDKQTFMFCNNLKEIKVHNQFCRETKFSCCNAKVTQK